MEYFYFSNNCCYCAVMSTLLLALGRRYAWQQLSQSRFRLFTFVHIKNFSISYLINSKFCLDLLLFPRDRLDLQLVLERPLERSQGASSVLSHTVLLSSTPLPLLYRDMQVGKEKPKQTKKAHDVSVLGKVLPLLVGTVLTTILALCHLVHRDGKGRQPVSLMRGLAPWHPFLPPTSAYLPCSSTSRGPTMWPVGIGNVWKALKEVVLAPSPCGHATPPPLVFSQLWKDLGIRCQALLG